MGGGLFRPFENSLYLIQFYTLKTLPVGPSLGFLGCFWMQGPHYPLASPVKWLHAFMTDLSSLHPNHAPGQEPLRTRAEGTDVEEGQALGSLGVPGLVALYSPPDSLLASAPHRASVGSPAHWLQSQGGQRWKGVTKDRG